MEKTDSNVVYDDRRKELTHQVDSEQEAKNKEGEIIGVVTTKLVGVYKEKGIKKIVSEMENDVKNLNETIQKAEESLEKLKDVEETEEMKKWRKIQELIPKLREKEQFENQLEGLKDQLKKTKKDLNKIKEVVGSRLKL